MHDLRVNCGASGSCLRCGRRRWRRALDFTLSLEWVKRSGFDAASDFFSYGVGVGGSGLVASSGRQRWRKLATWQLWLPVVFVVVTGLTDFVVDGLFEVFSGSLGGISAYTGSSVWDEPTEVVALSAFLRLLRSD